MAKRSRPQKAEERTATAEGFGEGREPSVLDWFQSLLRLRPIPIPEADAIEQAIQPPLQELPAEAAQEQPTVSFSIRAVHLRLPIALGLALLAQASLIRRGESIAFEIALYLIAAAIMAWAAWAGDFGIETKASRRRARGGTAVRIPYLAAGALLTMLNYIASAGNTFHWIGIVFWISSVLCILLAFWDGEISLVPYWNRLTAWLARPKLRFSLGPPELLLILALMLSVFFRLYDLAGVPPEMWSDHAEKILDILDVLDGRPSIFFPRNAGREPAQFYATAAAMSWFGAELNFMTLKSITALAGLLTLPFIYMLGRELAGKPTGLIAMALAGVAYWPNILSRVGMRLPFHPLLAAPAMAFLVRGLRQKRRNDLLLSGLALGAGLYGYTAARLTPLVILAGMGLYLVHAESRKWRRTTLLWFGMLVAVSLVVAVPMLRVAQEFPEDVFYRTVTRVGSAERPLPGHPVEIFFSNMWNALLMFSWDAGQTWILALPFRPILDWLTAALFHLGVAALSIRYIRHRRWEELFVLLSVPLLLLPSVLSLAFPIENPHPSRAGGAIIPTFIIAAVPLVALLSWARSAWAGRRLRWIGYGTGLALFALITLNNYRLVFGEYGPMMRRGSWNTSEAGEVVRAFVNAMGDFDQVYMVAYPHWMDSRLIAANAGWPGEDIGIWPDQLAELPEIDDAQLYLLNLDTEDEVDQLEDKFPRGILTRYHSAVEDRDFLIYLVPAAGRIDLSAELDS